MTTERPGRHPLVVVIAATLIVVQCCPAQACARLPGTTFPFGLTKHTGAVKIACTDRQAIDDYIARKLTIFKLLIAHSKLGGQLSTGKGFVRGL